MNKRQAEVVAELLEDEFYEEAMVLARAYATPTEVFANEKVAEDKAMVFAVDLLMAIFRVTALTIIINKLIAFFFPGKVKKEKVRGVATKATVTVISFIKVLAPFILFLLVANAMGGSPAIPDAGRAKARAKVYEERVSDNLAGMKRQMDRMMRNG